MLIVTFLFAAPHQARAADPVAVPLWQQSATQAAVLDSFKLVAKQYIGMSFSATPTPSTVAGVFSELGAYDRSKWRLGHWQADLDSFGRYDEPPGFSTVRQGFGYWLITKDTTRVHYTSTVTTPDSFEIPLTRSKYHTVAKGDWNQVGNPFAFATGISANNWRIVKRDTVQSFTSASNYVDTNPRLYNSVTKNYNAATTIPRDSAFWVRAVDRDTGLAWTSWRSSPTARPYVMTDNTMGANGPTFGWIEISGTGTPIFSSAFGWDDNISGAIALPFSFPYYGNTYSSVYVCTNGWLTFEPTTSAFFGNGQMASGVGVPSMVCPFWDDLILPAGANHVLYQNVGGRFVIEWVNVEHFGGGAGDLYSFEVIIDSNGDITFQYLTMTDPPGWTPNGTVGIQDKPMTGGAQAVFNGVYAVGSRATRFRPTPSPFFTRFSTKVDNSGVPHVAYQDGISGRVVYAYRKGTRWIEEVVDAAASYESVSLALDPTTQLPRIAYQGRLANGNGKLMYAVRNAAGVWSTQDADPVARTGFSASLAIGSDGFPRIAYVDKTVTGGRLMMASLTSSWATEVADTTSGGEITGSVSLALDSGNRPHIGYQGKLGDPNHRLRYLSKPAAAWVREDVDTQGDAGYSSSIAVTSAGAPRIVSGTLSSGYDVRFASKAGTVWTNETPAASGDVGVSTALALTKAGEARIAFTDQTNGRIMHSSPIGGGTWVTNDIADVGPGAGMSCAIAIDPDGNSKIAYIAGVLGAAPALRIAEKTRGLFRLQIAPVAAPAPLAPTALARPEDAAWALAVVARLGDRQSEPLMVGVGTPAEGRTLNMTPVPSPPYTETLDLLSTQRVGDEDAPFVRDFRPEAQQMTWTIQVNGATGPGELVLEFSGLGVPAGMRFVLSDPAAGWSREVKSGDLVTLAATGSRRLSLIADASGVMPQTPLLVDGIRFAYPNPFSDRLGLAFTLARPGDIVVNVYDVQGRRIRDLSRLGAAPGEQVLMWDGRDDRGRSAATGVYFARYRAGSASGVRRVVKVE
jgi:hypothetical protein